jgi:putative flippase GtrA
MSGTALAKLSGSRFLRFAAVGAAGFFVDEGVLFLGQHALGIGPYLARTLSIMTAMTFTWWGNRTITFHKEAASGLPAMAREWLRFVGANMAGAVVNFSIYVVLINFATPPINNYYLATACGVGVGLIFNFTLSKYLVFRG